MAKSKSSINLLDAVNNADPHQRDDALDQLLKIACGMAQKRLPHHAESVAQSAVAEVVQRASAGKISAEHPGKLGAYLRRAVNGKVGNRIRKQHREPKVEPIPTGGLSRSKIARSGSTTPGEAEPRTSTTIAAKNAFVGEVQSFLRQYPVALHDTLRELIHHHFKAQPTLRIETLFRAVGNDAAPLVRELEVVVGMFPRQLQGKAEQQFAIAGPLLPSLLRETKARLETAKTLSKEHRLMIHMLEAGYRATDVAKDLGATPGNVRLVDKRNRDRARSVAQPTPKAPSV